MAFAMQKLRNIFVPVPVNKSTEPILDPEVGFKVNLNEFTNNKELKVTVIGARHLPTLYGLNKTEGYVIKVKLFPGREKFETKLQKESWPMFNQEFTFKFDTNSTQLNEQINGKFIVLTVYAILENIRTSDETKSKSKSKSKPDAESTFRTLFYSKSNVESKDELNKNERISLYKRRTIGAVTYSLDAKAFTQKLRNNCLGTPDIWRTVQSISSGLIQSKSNANDKGSAELSFNYSVSEDGQNDRIIFALLRLRFSVQTMEMHENCIGFLYLKMKIYSSDAAIAKWKSDKFEPTISMKFDAPAAQLQTTVRGANSQGVRCEVCLMCKNKMGKKSQLGSISISAKDEQWLQAIASPDTSIVIWHHFT